ncbi:hypothetical protein MMC25_003894 [Agyrium rufum]|nr:hypothetical protein [Agyrium rufum]
MDETCASPILTKRQVIYYEDGDTVLELETAELTVCSGFIQRVSPYFKAMARPGLSEGNDLAAGARRLRLLEDDTNAMIHVFAINHFKFDLIPELSTYDELDRIAQTAEQYGLAAALRFWSKSTLQTLTTKNPSSTRWVPRTKDFLPRPDDENLLPRGVPIDVEALLPDGLYGRLVEMVRSLSERKKSIQLKKGEISPEAEYVDMSRLLVRLSTAREEATSSIKGLCLDCVRYGLKRKGERRKCRIRHIGYRGIPKDWRYRMYTTIGGE